MAETSTEKTVSPKRKKQLDALAKGREALAEKREAEKKAKEAAAEPKAKEAEPKAKATPAKAKPRVAIYESKGVEPSAFKVAEYSPRRDMATGRLEWEVPLEDEDRFKSHHFVLNGRVRPTGRQE
jgi:hypothetical protein